MRAVRFDRYGGVDVLEVRDVEDPIAEPGRVVISVKAAGINFGETKIRKGLMHRRWPAIFPSGEGSDLAGLVKEVGAGVSDFDVGNEVLGWSEERSSHAELVSVPAAQVIPKPASLPWEVAGSLFVAGMAALACVRAVAPKAGERVAVSAAAGGVGSIAVQLARRTGATVIGLAGEHNHEWLRAHDVIPLAYGEGQTERLREAADGRLDAFIDTIGGGYVELAVELGVPVQRINTIADFPAAGRLGIMTEGTHSIASPELLAQLARLAADGEIDVPIAGTFPLERVRDAYRQLEQGHTRGKLVLLP